MSASSKKKLRAQENAAKLTEKQLNAKKESRNLKIYTAIFVIAIIALVGITIFVSANNYRNNPDRQASSTVAATVGNHEISTVELGYYYFDAIQNFYSQNGPYIAYFGLDMTQPLDQQLADPSTGRTWADYFLDTAVETAAAMYALADEAEAHNFKLSDEYSHQLDLIMQSMEDYAVGSNLGSLESYLKNLYGPGSSAKTYKAYYARNMLAQAYYEDHENNLTFTNEQLRAAEAENIDKFSSFSFNQYFLRADRFLPEGVEDPSDEQVDASVAEAKEAAQTIVDAKPSTVVELDDLIAALPINADSETPAASTAVRNQQYASVNNYALEWLCDSARSEGDITVIPSTSAVDDSIIDGYYVFFFVEKNDNTNPLVNVRHILVNYESADGSANYTDADKAVARVGAEAILAEWNAGAHTEESFAALATEKTGDPGSKETGGLYENIYPGQMVSAFNDWCFDAQRKPGDVGIVETNYGCHVMYFSGNSDTNYRDLLIRNELTESSQEEWYYGLVDAMTVNVGDTSMINKGLVMQTLFA